MIESDVIPWIIDRLAKERDALSEYSLEYTTALLMNLSLRVAGKNKCEQMPRNSVLTVLSDLIEHENMVVRTHVNGTLYSILTRPSLKAQAHDLGMPRLLEYLLEQSDE
jgi:LisH domain-containing protein ARMC9